MNKGIKKIVEDLFTTIQALSSDIDDAKNISKVYAHRARREILNFLMYLSAADGSISEKESFFLKDYFDEQLSPEEICKTIEEDDLYSVRFEQKIPNTLKKLVRFDNAMYDRLGFISESMAERYICLYEAIGMEFCACDREVSQCERDDLSTYIKNMRSFYRANYKGPDEATEASHIEHALIGNIERGQRCENNAETNAGDDESLEGLIAQLNSLVGLENVKSTVSQLVHFNAIRKKRDEYGLKQMPISQHMVFYGNPGTGKTTVARLIAKIYHELGILSKGHLVEVDRSGLVAGYVGHTALKVKDVIKQARGGVLFIDEAYALTYKRSDNDFGFEAVDTLIKALEDEREDLVVIVAGYPEPMKQFINSNPGLKSRFNRFLDFKDYSGEELFAIFNKMLADSGYTACADALFYSALYFKQQVIENKEEPGIGFNSKVVKKDDSVDKDEIFANARMVRNYLEMSVMRQADRLYSKEKVSEEDLKMILFEDVAV